MSILAHIVSNDWTRGFKLRTCAGESCGRWLTERKLFVQPVGVTLDERWYCSYRCVFHALESALRRLAKPSFLGRPQKDRRSLALELLQRNLLTEDQYKVVLAVRRDKGQDVEDTLLELGYASESVISDVRALMWSCPVMNGDLSPVGHGMRLPTFLAHRYGMAVVHILPALKRLFLGFRYDVEYVPLSAVEVITGYRAEPCILPASKHTRLIETYNSSSGYDERVFKEPSTFAEMALSICELGRETDAVKVTLARCGQLIWCRLSGGYKTIDTLFAVT